MALRRPARVLFVNDHLGYPGGVWHGVTRYAVDVLPGLDRKRFRVTACFLRDPHPAESALRGRGVEPRFLSRHRLDSRALSDLGGLIRGLGIDLLHLGGNKALLLGRLAARRAGVPTLIHLHDVNPPGILMGPVQRRLARWTSRAVAVSAEAAAAAARDFAMPAGRIRVLPNGVSPATVRPSGPGAAERARAGLKLPAGRPVAGIIGRLSPEKGHELLLRLWPSLMERAGPAMLLVVGDGPRRGACEELVRRLGLEESVRLAGHRGDLGDLLPVMDAVAVPSSREGFGYAALEAMAAGRPVVGFAVGGLRSLVEEGDAGVLAEPGDGPALVEALARVLGDAELRDRLGRSARKRAEQFSLESHLRGLQEIYQEALEEGPPWARSGG